MEPISQKIFWGVNQGLGAGAFIESIHGEFIPWEQLSVELNERVINQAPRIIPVGSTATLDSFYGKEDWLVNIRNLEGDIVGSVWVGGNPEDGWKQDGLVRTGKAINDTEHVVYQTFQRFSDGSYRLVQSNI
jgi:hypothetical protein